MFIFSEQTEVDRVLAGEPWLFDKYLVALKRIGHQTEMKDWYLIVYFFGFRYMTSL